MQELLQVTVFGVLTVILTTLLKKHNGELALLLTLAGCVILAIVVIKTAKPVVSFLTTLRQTAGIERELMTPLLKTVAIGLLTQVGGTVCADAGETSIARLIELCGSILAVYVSLPLLEAVLQMLETMGGG